MSVVMQVIQIKRGWLSEWERGLHLQHLQKRDDLSTSFTVGSLGVPEPQFGSRCIIA